MIINKIHEYIMNILNNQLTTSILKQWIDGNQWYGVDINSESISNNYDNFVWEPALVKINILSASTEAANLILSVDETVRNPQSEKPDAAANARARGAMMAARGRGVTRR